VLLIQKMVLYNILRDASYGMLSEKLQPAITADKVDFKETAIAFRPQTTQKANNILQKGDGKPTRVRAC
jgi:hypothetical protein